MNSNTIFLKRHDPIISCCAACDYYLNMTCEHAYDTGSTNGDIHCNQSWWGVPESTWTTSTEQGCYQVQRSSSSDDFVCVCSDKITGYSLWTDDKCTCSNGYTYSNSAKRCSACPAGKYKGSSTFCSSCARGEYSLAGAQHCSDCEIGKYSNDLAAPTCSACPANSTTEQTGNRYQSGCVCNPGYVGPNGGPCTACAAGKYRSEGDNDCVDCEAGKYSGAPGATNESTCELCPSFSSSPAGSTSVMSCVFCANGMHNCDGNATCQETPGSFTCTCNHGYESLETALGLVPRIVGGMFDTMLYLVCSRNE